MARDEVIKNNPIPFFFRIVFLSNNYRDPLLRRIEYDYGLTRPEFSILICLSLRMGMSAIDIADITRQPENTVGRGVFLLLKKNMIRKVADPADGRRFHLHLTEKGRNAYDSLIHLVRDANDQMVACLNSKELAQLDALLDKMCGAVGADNEKRETNRMSRVAELVVRFASQGSAKGGG